MICTALVLVFVQASVAGAMANIQHAVGVHGEHRHLLFADVILDFDHHADADDDHHDQDSHYTQNENAPGHAPSHHHHGNDLGSSSFVLVTAVFALPERIASTETPVPGRLLVDVRHSLPERPPRTGLISA